MMKKMKRFVWKIWKKIFFFSKREKKTIQISGTAIEYPGVIERRRRLRKTKKKTTKQEEKNHWIRQSYDDDPRFRHSPPLSLLYCGCCFKSIAMFIDAVFFPRSVLCGQRTNKNLSSFSSWTPRGVNRPRRANTPNCLVHILMFWFDRSQRHAFIRSKKKVKKKKRE